MHRREPIGFYMGGAVYKVTLASDGQHHVAVQAKVKKTGTLYYRTVDSRQKRWKEAVLLAYGKSHLLRE